ncbi:MAG: hypothetical protein K2V38_09175, partial [Gemmataceae bacterium]|nr:hypothetical protein [Gemmataceae bacterium]
MRPLLLVALLAACPLVLIAHTPSHTPDDRKADKAPEKAPAKAPDGVERCDAGYRYSQDGWVVLHIEGEPYTRGYQHGKLLAKEIAAQIRMLSTQFSAKAPADGWKSARRLANALFLRKIDREVLEEMRGIADGATDGGADFDGHDIDLVDVAVVNAWMEIDSLDAALDATPTGLEGKDFPRPGAPKAPAPRPAKGDHCSAFVATGPATADGKAVMGHLTMAGLTSGPFVNVWIDVQPKKGRRFVMQAFPGGVWSSQDYYINDAGILLCETTIGQTPFDPTGTSLVGRARKAIQYGESIDAVVK